MTETIESGAGECYESEVDNTSKTYWIGCKVRQGLIEGFHDKIFWRIFLLNFQGTSDGKFIACLSCFSCFETRGSYDMGFA
jgi:hypothetical protein